MQPEIIPMLTTCRSCGAQIWWVQTTKGKPMPLDPLPVEDGNVVMLDGRAKVLGKRDRGTAVPRYRSHFSTCPGAASFRQRK